MQQTAQKMGEKFQAKREEMNLSLKEVENATSIRMSYLEAIENGQIYQKLSPVYVVGFIQQYSQFLGIDSKELSKEYPEVFRSAPPKQDFSYGIGTLEMRSSPAGNVRWLPNMGWGALFVLLGITAWYFGKWIGAF